MAESLDDGEFWLPPEFLTDNDIAMEKNERDSESTKTLFPFEFSYGGFGSSSDLSSPVERWLLADRGRDRGGLEGGDRDRGGRSRPRPRWTRMEETETEVEQIVAEMVTGGADRG